jgi:hypothetical protein
VNDAALYCRHPEQADHPDVTPVERAPRSREEWVPAVLGLDRVCVMTKYHTGDHMYDIATEVQRGWRPARTIPALVDACRQDLATAGAQVYMLNLRSERFPELAPVIRDLERTLSRVGHKLSLAMDAAHE